MERVGLGLNSLPRGGLAWHRPAMAYEEREHAGHHYGVQFMYALPEDAWFVELTDVASDRMIMMAVVPDEDLTIEPTVRVHAPEVYSVPYEVMVWFMAKVAEEIARSRPDVSRGGTSPAGATRRSGPMGPDAAAKPPSTSSPPRPAR
ncbi:hypothetical protein Amsp01_029790 [Amycolatopsis sp. NBRC 101858]|nr:hypothetical protein Amsp01_029790 [Amycolatopsis sp. NBRC 101858]